MSKTRKLSNQLLSLLCYENYLGYSGIATQDKDQDKLVELGLLEKFYEDKGYKVGDWLRVSELGKAIIMELSIEEIDSLLERFGLHRRIVQSSSSAIDKLVTEWMLSSNESDDQIKDSIYQIIESTSIRQVDWSSLYGYESGE